MLSTTAALRERLRKRSLGVIDPRTSKFVPYWDAITTVAILFTAFVTPFEVSFLPAASSWGDALFLVNRVIDVVFIVDIYIAFHLVYQHGERWVDSRREIMRHYLVGWFPVDVISTFISVVDIYGLYAGSGADLNSLRILRALRALRLIKLVRIARASRIFKRWETRFAINYTTLELCKCLTAMLMAAHWFSCFWVLQAGLLSESVLDSWLGAARYCQALPPATSTPGDATPGSSLAACPKGWVCRSTTPEIACLPPGNLYAASLYWAVMTITSIGYGDISATAQNAPEQIACTVLIIFGSGLWGYVIGTFCGTIANLSPATSEFRRNMDDLNAYMVTHAVDWSLRVRLREYFFRTRHIHDSESQQRLLLLMSPKLQSELVLAVHQKWIRNVSPLPSS